MRPIHPKNQPTYNILGKSSFSMSDFAFGLSVSAKLGFRGNVHFTSRERPIGDQEIERIFGWIGNLLLSEMKNETAKKKETCGQGSLARPGSQEPAGEGIRRQALGPDRRPGARRPPRERTVSDLSRRDEQSVAADRHDAVSRADRLGKNARRRSRGRSSVRRAARRRQDRLRRISAFARDREA